MSAAGLPMEDPGVTAEEAIKRDERLTAAQRSGAAGGAGELHRGERALGTLGPPSAGHGTMSVCVHFLDIAQPNLSPPATPLLAMETMAVMEYATFVTLAPLLVRTARCRSPSGARPAGLHSLGPVDEAAAKALADAGHSVHGWGLGPNVGPHPHVLRGLQQRVLDLTGRYGRTVSLVGWSLGGIYARELARADPDHVRLVITLGSPYRFRPGDRGHASGLYAAVAPEHDPFPGRLLPEDDRPAVPVPSTSIYTRTDGIVHWSACIDGSGPRAREHRGGRHPQRARVEPRRAHRHHRPAVPTRGRLEAVPSLTVRPPPVPLARGMVARPAAATCHCSALLTPPAAVALALRPGAAFRARAFGAGRPRIAPPPGAPAGRSAAGRRGPRGPVPAPGRRSARSRGCPGSSGPSC